MTELDTNPGLKLGHKTFSFLLCESLCLLKTNSYLAYLNFQLLPQSVRILVVLPFLVQFIHQTIHFQLKAICTFFCRSASIEGLVDIGGQRLEVGFQAAVVATQACDANCQFIDASARLTQLTFSILSSPLRLPRQIEHTDDIIIFRYSIKYNYFFPQYDRSCCVCMTEVLHDLSSLKIS